MEGTAQQERARKSVERTDVETEEPGTQTGGLPESVEKARDGKLSEIGVEEVDATAWLLESDSDDDEVVPTTVRVNIGDDDNKRIIQWKLIPLDSDQLRRFRQMAMGNRASRRGQMGGDPTQMDDAKYHLLCVTAATVEPNLQEVAKSKNVPDPSMVVRHRFRHKPGIIVQLSGIVSDISGYNESDVEVAAGNS